MSLQGSFETIALSDVMALLAAGTKSGELRVVGGQVEGRLWLQTGRLVASKVGRAEGHVDALFELLRLTEGNFVFRDGVEAPEPGEAMAIEPLVHEAEKRLKEWRDIVLVLPSAEHRVRLVPDLPTPEVTLSADEWRVVMAIALAGTVQGVLEELHCGQFEGFRGICRLVDAGLVQVDPPRVRPASHRLSRRLTPVSPGEASGAAPAEADDDHHGAGGTVHHLPLHFAGAATPSSLFPGPGERANDDQDDAGDRNTSRVEARPEPLRSGQRARQRLAAVPTEAVPPHTGSSSDVTGRNGRSGDGGYGGEAGGESINRGLLLKFLSSVRS